MRSIVLVDVDKIRPALVLTRDIALPLLNHVTIAPITSTIRGISTEVNLSERNGLDHACVATCDNIATVSKSAVVKQIGILFDDQEDELSTAIAHAFDLRLLR
ncbi:MAG: type II toxin-antitoxin system PemK/MazF family toxin [Propionibacteriaceae bacterium]|jgi:mRNA interferase MazF|nr:type II toxin-antitoxin system PemK/MazF family toxin [Propionibacteriaceae bacterium]